MTLTECYQRNYGNSVSVDGVPENSGQCVQWADVVLRDVYEQPIHYGNAIDWWNDPKELLDHFDKIDARDDKPKVGDFVIWGSGVGSIYGHIDVCAEDGTIGGFTGYDSNWGGNKTVHTVRHDYRFVVGYLRPKINNKENDMPNDGDVDNVYLQFNGRKATDEEKKVYTQKSWSAGDGLYYGKVAVDVANILKALDEARNSTYKPLGQEVFVKE